MGAAGTDPQRVLVNGAVTEIVPRPACPAVRMNVVPALATTWWSNSTGYAYWQDNEMRTRLHGRASRPWHTEPVIPDRPDSGFRTLAPAAPRNLPYKFHSNTPPGNRIVQREPRGVGTLPRPFSHGLSGGAGGSCTRRWRTSPDHATPSASTSRRDDRCARRRPMIKECIWLTRDSDRSSAAPISFMVRCSK